MEWNRKAELVLRVFVKVNEDVAPTLAKFQDDCLELFGSRVTLIGPTDRHYPLAPEEAHKQISKGRLVVDHYPEGFTVVVRELVAEITGETEAALVDDVNRALLRFGDKFLSAVCVSSEALTEVFAI